MATTGTTAKIGVEVEARTDAAVANFDKLKKAEADAKAQLVELDKQFAQNAATASGATGKMAAGFGKAKDAAKQLAPSLTGVAVAAAQGNVNLGNIAAAALAASNAFGPWGIAIGVAATALFTLASASDSAADASRRHREELIEEYRAAGRLADQARLAQEWVERLRGQKIVDNTVLRGLRDTESFLEEEAAIARGRADKDQQSEVATAQAKARAEILREEGRQLRSQGDEMEGNRRLQEAELVLRQNNLRLLEEENRQEDKKTASKKEQLRLTGEQLAMEARVARRSDATVMRSADESIVAGGAAADESTASRFGGELSDPFSREADMQQAEEMERARQERLTELRQYHHDKQMQMQAEDAQALQDYQDKALAMGNSVGATLETLAQTWMASGDMSSKGLAKSLKAFGKQETIRLGIVALRESILAIAAAASFNIPQATAHGVAAAKAAAGAITVGVLTGAAGGFAGGGGGGGSQSSFSPAAPANTGPAGNTQADRVPTSEAALQQSGSAAASAGVAANGGGNVTNIGAIYVTGSIDDETAMKITQAQQRALRRLGKQSA